MSGHTHPFKTTYMSMNSKIGTLAISKQVLVIDLRDTSADYDAMAAMMYAWLREQGFDCANVDVEEVES